MMILILVNSCSDNRETLILKDVKAGSIEQKIKILSTDIDNIGALIISGYINKTDLHFIDKLKKISVIDLKNAEILDIETLPKHIFTFNSSITAIILPRGIDSIGELSFFCMPKLEKVQMPNSIIYIGRASFSGSEKLHDISLSSSLKKIGANAFDRCENLKNIKLPESLEIIDSSAFLSCEQLEFIRIPAKVSYIGRLSFTDCKSLENIIIEGNPTIDYMSFYDAGVKNLYLKSEIPPIVLNCDFPVSLFGNNSDKINIFVPKGSLYRYINTPVWKQLWKNMKEE